MAGKMAQYACLVDSFMVLMLDTGWHCRVYTCIALELGFISREFMRIWDGFLSLVNLVPHLVHYEVALELHL